jgi:uncharacterized membrane protein
MNDRKPTPERLGAFSDGVFAVIITIMVLDLKPPPQPSFAALLPLWSTAVSYLFVAIVWVNHHHLLRPAYHATPRLIWWNFAHLFAISLVPVSTAWVAVTRFAAVPVAVYAAVFAMVVSLKFPLLGFGLVPCVLFAYLRPEDVSRHSSG